MEQEQIIFTETPITWRDRIAAILFRIAYRFKREAEWRRARLNWEEKKRYINKQYDFRGWVH